MKKLWLLLVLFMFGCAVVPPEGGVKKVYIHPFSNQTVQYSLHTDLFTKIQEEFLRETYLELIPTQQNAEYVVSGVVILYDLKPISYSIANKVESYEMTVEVEIILFNNLEKREVFRERFDTTEIFFTKEGNSMETKSDTELEKETQTQAINFLARNITRRVTYAK